MKLCLDDETYFALRAEADRQGLPVPKMIRIMCQTFAKRLIENQQTQQTQTTNLRGNHEHYRDQNSTTAQN